MRDRLFLAPVENPKRILDLGTGTGTWAIDVADKFENADVIGIDLSPVPPGMRPDNVRFEVDDICSPWVYPEDHFDFIHIRGLVGSVADWPDLYAQAFKHMAPGGYIEHIEWSPHVRSLDGTLSTIPVLRQFSDNFVEVGARSGKTWEIAENMAGLIREVGLADVVEKRFKWPVGPWSSDERMKDIGRWNLLNWEEGLEGWTLAAYTRVLKVCPSMSSRLKCWLMRSQWSYAEVQEWLKEVRAALRHRKNHVYHEVYVLYPSTESMKG